MPPVLALLTDFGHRDHYVAAMKGVILGLCPDAVLVDLCHEVPPQNLAAGAYLLGAACDYFPDQTVFLAVVDPGVGGARRVLAVETERFRFVAPDNGLLSEVLAAQAGACCVSVTNREFFLPEVSHTFHGRDLFAPVAAHLARGVALERFGHEIDDPVRLTEPPVRRAGADLAGVVVYVDRFGNCITNIRRAELIALCPDGDFRALHAEIGGRSARWVNSYAGAPPGTLVALLGSSGRLELSLVQGDLAATLAPARGAAVAVRANAAGAA